MVKTCPICQQNIYQYDKVFYKKVRIWEDSDETRNEIIGCEECFYEDEHEGEEWLCEPADEYWEYEFDEGDDLEEIEAYEYAKRIGLNDYAYLRRL